MNLEILDPIEYPDWDALLLRNGDYSFFHSSAWAKALKESYGYDPVYFASIEAGRLSLLMPFMNVVSPLTGQRGVSLPFTDGCAPFFLIKEALWAAVKRAIDFGKEAGWKYIEWRDSGYFSKEPPPSEVYYTHDLNLLRTEPELFSSLKSSNRRNVNKAIKEGVSIKIGRSLDSLKSFYRLNCMTRRRHGLPPQPFFFFKNVFDFVISKGYGIVFSAFHSNNVVAASVFFHFGKNAIYKYGASNMKYQNLRPSNLLMWEAIKWYRNEGYENLNFGRTEVDNQGLLQFKRLWGTIESPLKYYRYNCRKKTYLQNRTGIDFRSKMLAWIPTGLFRIFGRLFYKHIGLHDVIYRSFFYCDVHFNDPLR
jgi:hypothetical protein